MRDANAGDKSAGRTVYLLLEPLLDEPLPRRLEEPYGLEPVVPVPVDPYPDVPVPGPVVPTPLGALPAEFAPEPSPGAVSGSYLIFLCKFTRPADRRAAL